MIKDEIRFGKDFGELSTFKVVDVLVKSGVSPSVTILVMIKTALDTKEDMSILVSADDESISTLEGLNEGFVNPTLLDDGPGISSIDENKAAPVVIEVEVVIGSVGTSVAVESMGGGYGLDGSTTGALALAAELDKGIDRVEIVLVRSSCGTVLVDIRSASREVIVVVSMVPTLDIKDAGNVEARVLGGIAKTDV